MPRKHTGLAIVGYAVYALTGAHSNTVARLCAAMNAEKPRPAVQRQSADTSKGV